jgi:BCCT family betaine/carnitine transporter
MTDHARRDIAQDRSEIDYQVGQRVFWCIFEGLVAATLLLVGGAEALTALQAMAVSTSFPFTIVLLLMCVSLFIGLNRARTRIR